jgi:WD40 repeat protein
MAFLHRRTSPGGHERLVNVEVSSGDSFGGPEIHWMVVIPGSFAPQAQMRSGQLLELQRNSRTEMFKVMAGQPDAADASHFTIDYYFNGQRGTIDGWLCNDDTVRLQPQVGYVRENPNGLPRRWYIDDYASHTIFVSQPAQRLALPLVPKLAVSGNSTDPCCTYSPDGKLLAVSRNQCVHLWDLAAGQWVRRLDHAKNLGLTGIAFSHDGHLIAAMDYSGGISIWDVHTGQALPGWNGEVGTHNGTAFYKYSGGFCNSALAFGPDDKTLLAAIYGEYNKSAYLWDLTSGRMVQQFTPTGVKAWVRAMVLSPDGKTIAICSDGTGEDGRGYWSADAGKWIRKLPQQYSLPLDFSSDGKMLLALNSSHEVVLIDAATDGVLLKRLIPDGGAVGATNGGQSGQICPNGKALALRTYQYSALNFDSMHGAVAVWDLPKADTLWLLSDPSDDSMANKSVIDIPMTSLSFSPDGQFLATVGGKGAVLLWQLDKRLAKP